MSDPRVKVASDPEQVDQAGRQRRRDLKQEDEDLRVIVNTPAGRRFYWRALELCRLFAPSYVGGENAVNETLVREGERRIGRALFNWLMKAAPEQFYVMQQEAKKREEA